MEYTYPKYSLWKIGSLISSRRSELNMDIPTTCQLLGVAKERFVNIESGNAATSFRELKAISDFLNISFDELTAVEQTHLDHVRYRSEALSDQTIRTLGKAKAIFVELIGQAQLRS